MTHALDLEDLYQNLISFTESYWRCPITLCIHSNLTVPQDCTKRAPIAQRLLLKHHPERADTFCEVLASTMLNQVPGIDPGTQLQTSIAHAASIVHGMKGKPCPIKPI